MTDAAKLKRFIRNAPLIGVTLGLATPFFGILVALAGYPSTGLMLMLPALFAAPATWYGPGLILGRELATTIALTAMIYVLLGVALGYALRSLIRILAN